MGLDSSEDSQLLFGSHYLPLFTMKLGCGKFQKKNTKIFDFHHHSFEIHRFPAAPAVSAETIERRHQKRTDFGGLCDESYEKNGCGGWCGEEEEEKEEIGEDEDDNEDDYHHHHHHFCIFAKIYCKARHIYVLYIYTIYT